MHKIEFTISYKTLSNIYIFNNYISHKAINDECTSANKIYLWFHDLLITASLFKLINIVKMLVSTILYDKRISNQNKITNTYIWIYHRHCETGEIPYQYSVGTPNRFNYKSAMVISINTSCKINRNCDRFDHFRFDYSQCCVFTQWILFLQITIR